MTDSGGRRTASTKIINFLSKNKYDVSVVDFETGIDPITPVKIKNEIGFDNKVHFTVYFTKSNKVLFPFLSDISIINRFDDVIFIGSVYFNIVAIMTVRIRRLFKGSKLILYGHFHPLRSIQFSSVSFVNFMFHLGYYFLSYFVYGLFDIIVTPGFDLKNFYVSRFLIRKEKNIVINNPIYTKRHNVEYIVRHKKKTIITASRLSIFQKDFLTLFKALKEVNKKIDCRLLILGEGEDKKKIIDLSKKLNVLDRIEFIGFKEDPVTYISKADVFVLSTVFEGCPIVLVEAMIGGVPVISSDCEFGPREILEDGKNGLLVPVADHKSMAEAILSLLENDKLKRKFINNGLNRAKFYSEERSYILWDKLLTNL